MHSAKNISKIPKRWFCPHCRKLPEFKPQKKKNEELPGDVLSLQSICVCNAVPDKNDKLLCCNSGHCKYGKYFHLSCLKYNKLPNNSKTTWICQWCKAEEVQKPSASVKQKKNKHLEEQSKSTENDLLNDLSDDFVEILNVTVSQRSLHLLET